MEIGKPHRKWLRIPVKVIEMTWNIWLCPECHHVQAKGWAYTKEGQKPNAKCCEKCGVKIDEDI